MFVGKSYFCENMFKLSVVKVNNVVYNFAFIVDSFDLWNNRLGHVNFSKLNGVKENVTFSEKSIRIPKSFDDNRNLYR